MTNKGLLLTATLFVLCTIALPQMQGGVVDAANTIRDVNFNSPLNNTYDLGNPYLVEYDNTTSLQASPNPNYDLQAIFSGNGTINGTRYTDSGVSSLDSRGINGTIVYQNGTIAITTEAGEKATAIFQSVGQRDVKNGIILDHGFMFFTTNSTTGELASLNNTVAVYKDKIDERRGNLTTVAWEWK
ncbi:MAG: hypothetical protein M3299_14095 [Thermoproteota archaeon]|nr:hypothetical protein [Thermoproteota archaeon]